MERVCSHRQHVLDKHDRHTHTSERRKRKEKKEKKKKLFPKMMQRGGGGSLQKENPTGAAAGQGDRQGKWALNELVGRPNDSQSPYFSQHLH